MLFCCFGFDGQPHDDREWRMKSPASTSSVWCGATMINVFYEVRIEKFVLDSGAICVNCPFNCANFAGAALSELKWEYGFTEKTARCRQSIYRCSIVVWWLPITLSGISFQLVPLSPALCSNGDESFKQLFSIRNVHINT